MNALEKVKAAAAKLDPKDQVELFQWWVQTDAFRERQLSALKQDIAVGIAQLDAGKYQNYGASQAMQLAEDVGRSGRERLRHKKI